MTKKALFIHGLHSDSESTTGSYVVDILKKYGYETIHPTFDLMDCNTTLEQINQIIKQENIELVTAHSLGGFYGYILPFEGPKLLINACLKPEIEIPKLMYPEQGEVFPENLKQEWPDLREKTLQQYNAQNPSTIYGIFAKNDDLFSYADYAKNELHFTQIQMIEGGHKPAKEELAKAIEKIYGAA